MDQAPQYEPWSLRAKALFYALLIFRTSWLSRMSGLQVWFYESSIFDLQGHYRPIRRHWFGVKRAYHYSVVWQSSLPKGTVITSLSSFQLTPGKGIIGNHPCNAVPLSFWQLSETTALWFCPFRCKIRAKNPHLFPRLSMLFLMSVFSFGLTGTMDADETKFLPHQLKHVAKNTK